MPANPHVREARRRWPAAVWIIGNGPWASVAYCVDTTVMLFATQPEADQAKAFIDRLACGHACLQEHELVNLDTNQEGEQ